TVLLLTAPVAPESRPPIQASHPISGRRVQSGSGPLYKPIGGDREREHQERRSALQQRSLELVASDHVVQHSSWSMSRSGGATPAPRQPASPPSTGSSRAVEDALFMERQAE